MNKQKEYNLCSKQESCLECASNHYCKAWVNFVLSHQDEKSYSHFDKRVSLAMPSIRKYVMDAQKVTAHSFYPFIHFTKPIKRYGKTIPKNRELYYSSHLDRCVYQRYAFLINQKYNKQTKNFNLENVAIAYRDTLGKNNIDFAKRAFDVIKEKSHCLIIVGDFTKFFDKLNHCYLKERICKLLQVEKMPKDYYAVYKNITRFAYWDWKILVEQTGHNLNERGVRKKINTQDIILSKNQFKKYKGSIQKNNSAIGIPQGSPISAVLSNVYMLDFDKAVNRYVSENNGTYMRYSDDFIIILPLSNDSKIKIHKNKILDFVKEIPNLDLQEEKTAIYTYSNENVFVYPKNEPSEIDYLGFVFNGKYIKLRPKSITKYYYRMRRKAKNIGRSNWFTPNGRHISAKNLYTIYSTGGKRQTFIDYAIRANNIMRLNDKEANALIKHHKKKIALAIKSGQKNND